MVAMVVNGHEVGTFEDAIRVIRDAAANKLVLEFREPNGEVIGTFAPRAAEPLVPWDPTITREELDRRLAGPGLAWDEAKKWMGWE
jgi:hypothetical protein